MSANDENLPGRLAVARQAFAELRQEQIDELLDPREQKILRLTLGLEDGRRYRNSEIKSELGIGDERVRQIQSQAVAKLEKAMSKATAK